jgi:hypothetical protein
MTRTANELLDEPLDYVAPPRGCAIYLVESESRDESDTNWTTGAPVMPNPALDRYSWKLTDLRKSDRLVDWSGVPAPIEGGRKCISKSYAAISGRFD